MDEHNIPQQGPEHGEGTEEYSFLQEVIKDEAGSRTRTGKYIMRMVGYGLVIGIAASFAFSVAKPWVEGQFHNNPTQVTIPQDEEEEPKKEETEQQPDQTEADESYGDMLRSLRTAALQTGKSMVEITGLTGEESWTTESDRNRQSVAGVILADNSRELLILGNVLPVEKTKTIQITFADGTRYQAAEKKRDSNLDLCIYAVTRNEIKSDTWAQVETVVLGSSNTVNIGDAVMILGKPFGCEDAVAYGTIVSNTDYKESADGTYGLVCTDVTGSEVGSGIIANVKGEVIGIVDQKGAGNDRDHLITGYSISEVKDVIELLSNGIVVPYVGIRGMSVTEQMEAKGLPTGIYVKEVEADSPAMAAGIQSGDILTSLDETEIMNLAVYHSMLMKQKEGDVIKLRGCRQGTGGEYVDIDFTVEVGSKK